MIQPKAITVIPSASNSSATSWVLTATGAFLDTQTVVIGGVTFTSVTNIGSTEGNFLTGGGASVALANLAALINDPLTTNLNQVALSADNARLITTILGLTAVATATTLTITSSNKSLVTVTDTETNAAWTSVTTSSGIAEVAFGQASLQFVASDITSGNAVFTVETSNDGINWTAYNRLVTNVTNTNSQTETRVASVTLSANGSSVVIMNDPFAYFRVKASVSTDGTYSVTAYMI